MLANIEPNRVIGRSKDLQTELRPLFKLAKPISREGATSVHRPLRLPLRPVGRPCETCRHSQRNAIDLALVGGEPLRTVAERFGLSHSSVARHKLKCVPTDLLEARRQRRVEDSEFL